MGSWFCHLLVASPRRKYLISLCMRFLICNNNFLIGLLWALEVIYEVPRAVFGIVVMFNKWYPFIVIEKYLTVYHHLLIDPDSYWLLTWASYWTIWNCSFLIHKKGKVKSVHLWKTILRIKFNNTCNSLSTRLPWNKHSVKLCSYCWCYCWYCDCRITINI